jgi:hypothetical protein
MQSLFFTLLDSGLVLAGHGYDFRGSPADDSGGGDDGGGLSVVLIAAAVLLVVGTVVVMWWLDRREREPDGGDAAPALRLKAVAPLALIVAVIAVPLVLWTASSGGDDEFDLKVERFTSVNTGEPELLVSIGEDVANTREQASGKRTVRIRCVGRDGKQILDSEQKWPFIRERGYDYAHAHQAATPEQVQLADRCRVLGTRTSLEAAVKGKLKD